MKRKTIITLTIASTALLISFLNYSFISENKSGTGNNTASMDANTATASLNGTVIFTGTAPPAKKIQLGKDPDACGSGTREFQEINVNNKGGLKGAVVYLEGVTGEKKFEVPENGYVLNQKGCDFVPHILVIQKGAEVTVLNSDPVLHNIHTYQMLGKVRKEMFSIAQPKQNQKITKKIDPQNSNIIKVECDVHFFMHAWILTLDNPYYSMTDASGNFKIENIPPGKYKLKVWNPTLPVKEKEIEIIADKENSITMELQKK